MLTRPATGDRDAFIEKARGECPIELGGVDPGIVANKEAADLHVPGERPSQAVGEGIVDPLAPDTPGRRRF